MVLAQRFLLALTTALMVVTTLVMLSLANATTSGSTDTVAPPPQKATLHNNLHAARPARQDAGHHRRSQREAAKHVTGGKAARTIVVATVAQAASPSTPPASTTPAVGSEDANPDPVRKGLVSFTHGVSGSVGNIPPACSQPTCATAPHQVNGGTGGIVTNEPPTVTTLDSFALVASTHTPGGYEQADAPVAEAQTPGLGADTTQGDPPPPGEDPIGWGPGNPDYDNSHVVP